MLNEIFKFMVVAHAQGAVTQLPSSTTFSQLGMRIINWFFAAGGGIAVIYIIYAGFTYMTAGADQAKTDQAKNTITYAIVGIIIIALSFVILNWINTSTTYISTPQNVPPNL